MSKWEKVPDEERPINQVMIQGKMAVRILDGWELESSCCHRDEIYLHVVRTTMVRKEKKKMLHQLKITEPYAKAILERPTVIESEE